jgi:hypothetical protein
MIRTWRTWLRSVEGQCALLAGTFAGAVILAIVPLILRERLFERYAYEKYPPLEGWAEKAVGVLTSPLRRRADLERLGEEMQERIDKADPRQRYDVLERIYGAWIADPSLDPDGLLPRRLTRMQPDWVFARLRQTLAAGRPDQRARAVEWLRLIVTDPRLSEQSLALLRYARRRAENRGEEDLRRQAVAVLDQGGIEHTP